MQTIVIKKEFFFRHFFFIPVIITICCIWTQSGNKNKMSKTQQFENINEFSFISYLLFEMPEYEGKKVEINLMSFRT